MPENKTTKPQNIWAKLMEIQKSIKTFATSEDADKKDSRGKAEYRYTPGWEIIEKLREQMDEKNLMLIPNCVSKHSEIIEYPVYKNFNGKAVSFAKKEMYVEVTMEFTWQDAATGETAGPFVSYGFGANGTDKSGATAMSMAERYFLLRFFHFTTREAGEEPDAHDSGNIPGFSQREQPANLPAAQAAIAEPVNSTQHQAQSPYPAAQPQPALPQPAYPVAPAQGKGYPAYPAPAPQGAPQPMGAPKGFDPNDPAIQAVICALANFDKNTNSHKKTLNENIGRLASMGYASTDPNFVISLVETAQAKREGRA